MTSEPVFSFCILYFIRSADCKISAGNGFIAVVQETNLYAIFINSNKIKHIFKSKNQSEYFTSVVCHPEEELILTGSNKGKIKAWRNFRDNVQPVIVSLYKKNKFSVLYYISLFNFCFFLHIDIVPLAFHCS